MVYPKPGPIGGTLIRKVIGFLKSQQVTLPLSTRIVIAYSGGCDSTALAHLLIHFGRRIVSPHDLSLLHINHGWRDAASSADADFAKNQAQAWNVPFKSYALNQKETFAQQQVSWEAEARKERKKIYEYEARTQQAFIWTAHHADDLVETLIWRLCTGKWATHSRGILFQEKREWRPLLTVRKKELRAYLVENNIPYREDETNHQTRFLRARMRQTLMPELEALFPKVVTHLSHLALSQK